MSSTGELACSYAALILYDDGIPITAEKIATLVKAANVKIDSYWPGLFAKLFEKKDIEDLILNIGAGGAAPVAVTSAGSAPAEAAAPAAEEKKEEVNEESDDDMILDIFGD